VATREKMLERIRTALANPSQEPSPVPTSAPPQEALAGVMPPIAPDEMLPKFEAELEKVGGTPHRAARREDLQEILHSILERSGARSVVLSRNPLLARLSLEEMLGASNVTSVTWPARAPEAQAEASPLPPVANSPAGTYREACFAAEVGITGVDFALAETGTLVVTSATEGSQLASLAPPIHIALYRHSQLVASLDEVLEHLTVPCSPDAPLPGRSVVFITGTSRTADIEQILIKGVHGPREVHAILVEDACLAG
jgi:L-lactate dehydrogenase complex protein LldG